MVEELNSLSALGELGAAQTPEITNEDKRVAGKIDLITGLLLLMF
jgi:hypothetical protein